MRAPLFLIVLNQYNLEQCATIAFDYLLLFPIVQKKNNSEQSSATQRNGIPPSDGKAHPSDGKAQTPSSGKVHPSDGKVQRNFAVFNARISARFIIGWKNWRMPRRTARSGL